MKKGIHTSLLSTLIETKGRRISGKVGSIDSWWHDNHIPSKIGLMESWSRLRMDSCPEIKRLSRCVYAMEEDV